MTRIISSETYLRRLFVTSALAHVLSLDACLPRAMPVKRKVSSRVNGAGGQDKAYSHEEEEVEDDKAEEEKLKLEDCGT